MYMLHICFSFLQLPAQCYSTDIPILQILLVGIQFTQFTLYHFCRMIQRSWMDLFLFLSNLSQVSSPDRFFFTMYPYYYSHSHLLLYIVYLGFCLLFMIFKVYIVAGMYFCSCYISRSSSPLPERQYRLLHSCSEWFADVFVRNDSKWPSTKQLAEPLSSHESFDKRSSRPSIIVYTNHLQKYKIQNNQYNTL